jgi:radical SAM protein with 4Fe4S-binding SPASM domain
MNKNSKVFCMVPFSHTYVEPDGSVRPCCVAQGEPFGNIRTENINDIWNGEKYKKFRLSMLNEETSVECRRCMVEETYSNQSMRISMNNLYMNHTDLVTSMNEDGSLPHMNLKRWDFRFSNLCNFACIGCSPYFSSTWGDLAKKMFYSDIPKFLNNNDYMKNFLESIFEHSADNVQQIYFAGGEPLMHWEHYYILDKMLEKGKFQDPNLEFSYSTNLSTLNFKGKNVLDYWSKMARVRICVSIDEVDEDRLYYIRYPSSISKLKPNLRILKETLKTQDQSYVITPTWSMLNVHRIKNFMEFLLEEDLLPNSFKLDNHWEHNFHLIIMLDPEYLSVGASTPEWKNVLLEKINEYEQWYIDKLIPLKITPIRFEATKIIKDNMERFRHAIKRTAKYNTEQWLDWITRLDIARETDWKTTFPELAWHLDKH